MLLFYVRHGDPIYNPDTLTEQGVLQAEALVERMKICRPQKIYSSPSNRALMTAKPTADYFGLDIDVLDWCDEKHAYKDLTFINKDGKREWICGSREHIRLFKTDEIYKLGFDWWQHPEYKDTNIKNALDRYRLETDNFMEELGYIREGNEYRVVKPKYERVALFAHHGFGLAFLSSLLCIPYPIVAAHMNMGHTGLTVISLGDEGYTSPQILQLSNDSHIFKSEKLKTVYGNYIEF